MSNSTKIVVPVGVTQMDLFLSDFFPEAVEGMKNTKVDAYYKYDNQWHKYSIQFFP